MPTGLTAQLDDKNLDTKTWIVEHLARQFGICVVIRDEGIMSSDEIKQNLKDYFNKSIKYHNDCLSESKKTLAEYNSFTDTDWIKLMNDANKKIKHDNEQSIKKANLIKVRHNEVRNDLNKLLRNDLSDVTRNIVVFGLNQLDLVKSEEEPYISSLFSDVDAFKIIRFDSVNRSIEYHSGVIKNETERYGERYDAFVALIDEVNKYLN